MAYVSRISIVVVALVSLLSRSSPAQADLGVPISSPAPLNADAANDSHIEFNPRIATDGNGNWVAVWSAYTNQGGPYGTDDDIYVARSVDNGQNWSIPVPLNSTAANDTGLDLAPDIATDRQGHWVAVWHLSPSVMADMDLYVARSIDNGATWSNAVPLNNNAATGTGYDQRPRIATDEHGHWVVVWISNDSLGNTIGTDSDILFARSIDNGANWSNPAPLNSTAGSDSASDSNPTIAMDAQGRCVAVWQSDETLGNTLGGDFEIFVARSLDAGASWSIPIPLNNNAADDSAGDSLPDIAMDDDGHCVAVWISSGLPRISPLYILTARSIDGGANWSSPVSIHARAADDLSIEGPAVLVTDRLGNWVAALRSNGGLNTPPGGTDLFIARSADNGANWSSPAPLNTNAGNNSADERDPSLVTDRHGAWLGAWQVASGGPLGADPDLFVARFALPDCNNNLIADSSELLLGLLPDINFNHVPDICEIIEGPPPGQTGCGGGACGVGAAAFAPVSLVVLRFQRRRKSPERPTRSRLRN